MCHHVRIGETEASAGEGAINDHTQLLQELTGALHVDGIHARFGHTAHDRVKNPSHIFNLETST